MEVIGRVRGREEAGGSYILSNNGSGWRLCPHLHWDGETITVLRDGEAVPSLDVVAAGETLEVVVGPIMDAGDTSPDDHMLGILQDPERYYLKVTSVTA